MIILYVYLAIVFILVFIYILYLLHIEIVARFYLAVKKGIKELENKQNK